MAAPFYKQPIYIVGLVVVAAAAVMLTGSDAPVTKKAAAKPPATTSKVVTLWTADDYKATFTPVSMPVKDVFKPLAARKTGPTLPKAPAEGLPIQGESGWGYSGMATVDGVPVALVENSTTSESVFLKRGQTWKHCTVRDFGHDSISITGPDGVTVKVKSRDTNATPAKAANPAATNPPLAGVTPLTGDIGAPAAVDPTQQPTGRRRGRGRNRGNQTDNGNQQ